MDCFVVPPRNDAKRQCGSKAQWGIPPTPFAKGDARSGSRSKALKGRPDFNL